VRDPHNLTQCAHPSTVAGAGNGAAGGDLLPRAFHIRAAGLAAVISLAVLSGCGGAKHAESGTKTRFAAAADGICADHLQQVMNLLNNEPPLASSSQQASEMEATFQIISGTIGRLEALGAAPNPRAESFGDYVKTLKARASLYRLEEEAVLHRDTRTALVMQRRILQIDNRGDGAARRYGLKVCGISPVDAAKALDLGGGTGGGTP
jgi:hypothetical protein